MPELLEPQSESHRRAVFAALVEAQDGGMSVPASRAVVAVRFGVSLDDLARIERAGLDGRWPPL